MPLALGARTLAALIDAIETGYSHSSMRTLFVRVGVDAWDSPRPAGINKATRAQRVLDALRQRDDDSTAIELATEVVKDGVPGPSSWRDPPIWWQPLVDALAGDGLEWDTSLGRLIPTDESISIPEERAQLETQLVELGWDVAAAHYRQAAEALSASRWESANAQVRSFLEALLIQAAAEILDAKPQRDPLAAIQDLKNAGTLFDGEYDFARGLWKLANPRGSHAGLSDRDEARFRLVAATAYARYLLSRLPA